MAQVYISVGSNINKEINIPSAINALKAKFDDIKISSLYVCDAVGFDGPEFFNLVVAVTTNLSVAEIVELCKQLELAHGREADAKKFTPRPLDLDLLLYDQQVLTEPAVIPRPEITQYAFVLWPLAEIAGNVRHPISNQTYAELWQAFDKKAQKIKQKPLSF